MNKLLVALIVTFGAILGLFFSNAYAQTASPSPTPVIDTDTNDDGDPDIGEDDDNTTPSGAPRTGFGTL